MHYLDHAASTAMRPEARTAIAAVWAIGPANPTGAHSSAQKARDALENAREQLANTLSVRPRQVVFTSGGTESDNWAIRAGAAGGTACCSAIEHPAVAAPVAAAGGITVPVLPSGVIDLDALESLLRSESDGIGCVSVMAANNETGVIQPLASVARLVADLAPGALFHTDAVQAFTKEPLDVAGWGLGAVSLSAHKIGGPIGTGALVLAADVDLPPLLLGGGQEKGRRAGTPDAAGAAAFAAAAEAACFWDWDRVRALRDRLELRLRKEIDGLCVYGAEAPRLATHCHVGIEGIMGDMAVIACDRAGLAVSSGSSCASGAQQESGTLAAMGASDVGVLRFSLGWTTSEEDIDAASQIVIDVVRNLRH